MERLVVLDTTNAECVVTNDAHFEVLRTIPFPKVNVVGIDEFITSLE